MYTTFFLTRTSSVFFFSQMDTLDDSTPLVPAALEDVEYYSDAVWSSAMCSVLESLDVSDSNAFDVAHFVGRYQGLVALMRSIVLETSADRNVRFSFATGEGIRDVEPDNVTMLCDVLCERANDLLHDAQIGLERIEDSKEKKKTVLAMLPVLVSKDFVSQLSRRGHETSDRSLLQPPPVFGLLLKMLLASFRARIY